MTLKNIPNALLEKVEAHGGYWIKSDPEPGAKGWVMSLELVVKDKAPADPQRITRVEFLFPTKDGAEICSAACSHLSLDGFVTLLGSVTKVEDFFCCSFCEGRRKEVGRLFRDEKASVAICAKCVRQFGEELS